eukprot:comp21257_c0_seq1/m.45448 comp21257_c0_seq1/g.45448  ORF comp21257_c0_seq1/g.45448 comp21257_c0_seq1/m.45448 type:complete len:403 (+) comp21257_c0_seq1:545-1753(+)
MSATDILLAAWFSSLSSSADMMSSSALAAGALAAGALAAGALALGALASLAALSTSSLSEILGPERWVTAVRTWVAVMNGFETSSLGGTVTESWVLVEALTTASSSAIIVVAPTGAGFLRDSTLAGASLGVAAAAAGAGTIRGVVAAATAAAAGAMLERGASRLMCSFSDSTSSWASSAAIETRVLALALDPLAAAAVVVAAAAAVVGAAVVVAAAPEADAEAELGADESLSRRVLLSWTWVLSWLISFLRVSISRSPAVFSRSASSGSLPLVSMAMALSSGSSVLVTANSKRKLPPWPMGEVRMRVGCGSFPFFFSVGSWITYSCSSKRDTPVSSGPVNTLSVTSPGDATMSREVVGFCAEKTTRSSAPWSFLSTGLLSESSGTLCTYRPLPRFFNATMSP